MRVPRLGTLATPLLVAAMISPVVLAHLAAPSPGGASAAGADEAAAYRVDGIERAFVRGEYRMLLYRRDGAELVPLDLGTSREPIRIVTDAPAGAAMWLVGTRSRDCREARWTCAPPFDSLAATLHVHAASDLDGGRTTGKDATGLHPVE